MTVPKCMKITFMVVFDSFGEHFDRSYFHKITELSIWGSKIDRSLKRGPYMVILPVKHGVGIIRYYK